MLLITVVYLVLYVVSVIVVRKIDKYFMDNGNWINGESRTSFIYRYLMIYTPTLNLGSLIVFPILYLKAKRHNKTLARRKMVDEDD